MISSYFLLNKNKKKIYNSKEEDENERMTRKICRDIIKILLKNGEKSAIINKL